MTAASIAIQTSFAQLRLAPLVQGHVRPIVLEYLDDCQRFIERIDQILRLDEPQVVIGSVILGELSVGGSGEASHRQIESRRAVLTLVVAVGDEVDELVRLVSQYACS